MLKGLLLGVLLLTFVTPTYALTIERVCVPGSALRQSFIDQGIPQNGEQVMHLSVDQPEGKVTVWETSPPFPDVHKTDYPATWSGTTVAWTIGDDEDQAHDAVDFSTNILTTIDPDGRADEWECSIG